MGWLTDLMSLSLEAINTIVGNYGVSIIIFTIIIKLILYPLSAKQTKSMKEMQDLQPEITKIQEQYKDDKEKLQQEMMKIYQESGTNPAAGCLPMIITMIIIFPLYRAIYGLEMTNETFLWIQNLAQPDIPLVILNGLAMVGQTYITQKFNTTGGKQNNFMIWMMPLMILFIGFQLPAGVLIYWFTQTALTAIQQFVIYYDPKVKEVAKE